jgi:hypothetical protein
MDLRLRKSEYMAERQALIEKLGKVAENVLTKGAKKKEKRRQREKKRLEAQQQADAAAVRYVPHPASPS